MTTNEGRCEPHEILALLRYEPETGCFFWKFREGARASDNTRRAGKAAGWRDEKGYVRIEIYKRTYKAHRLAWAYMTGSWPDGEIDHINGIPNDNRWVNLRAATIGQNQRNRGKPRSNTSGYKGVSFDKSTQKWRATIGVDGRHHYLGLFATAEEAAIMYQTAAVQMHGEFCYREVGR
jgi:hypothetical protein